MQLRKPSEVTEPGFYYVRKPTLVKDEYEWDVAVYLQTHVGVWGWFFTGISSLKTKSEAERLQYEIGDKIPTPQESPNSTESPPMKESPLTYAEIVRSLKVGEYVIVYPDGSSVRYSPGNRSDLNGYFTGENAIATDIRKRLAEKDPIRIVFPKDWTDINITRSIEAGVLNTLTNHGKHDVKVKIEVEENR